MLFSKHTMPYICKKKTPTNTAITQIMKNVLLLILGITPQIITQSIWACSVHSNTPLDEVYVITHSEGDEALAASNVEQQIDAMCAAWNIKKPRFVRYSHVIVAGTGDMSQDERTTSILNQAAVTISEIVNQPGTRLMCSIAGGRKTMSIAVAQVFSIMARTHDVLFHVIADEQYIKQGHYYPTPGDNENAVSFVEMPVLRLRHPMANLLKQKPTEFAELMKKAQDEVNDLRPNHKVVLDVDRRAVVIENIECTLQPLSFAVYWYLAATLKNIQVGKTFDPEIAKEIYEYYKKTRPSDGMLERTKSSAFKDEQMSHDQMTKQISIINGRLKDTFPAEQYGTDFLITVNGSYAKKFARIPMAASRIHIKDAEQK